MIIVNNPTGLSQSGLSQWTTATRPVSPANGTQGFNTTRNRAEYYANSFWIDGYFGLNAGLAFTIASLGTIAVGTSPHGVAYSPSNDRIYVANASSNNVSVINPATNTVVTSIAVGTSPHGVAYSPSNDRIYVSNFDSNNVSILS
jgi:40-residue YVTN family beta-propeller repeat